MRILALVLSLISLVLTPADATTYNIDLTAPGGVSGSVGGSIFPPPCYCAGLGEFVSPAYLGNPGDIFNFGSVVIETFLIGSTPDPSSYNTIRYGLSLVGVSFTYPAPLVPNLWGSYSTTESLTYNLSFEIPADGTSIQLAWYGPYQYTPPDALVALSVPEPSTWAMLLIGFAGIGFASYKTQTTALRHARHISRVCRLKCRFLRSGYICAD
jgi:hypothetical protein